MAAAATPLEKALARTFKRRRPRSDDRGVPDREKDLFPPREQMVDDEADLSADPLSEEDEFAEEPMPPKPSRHPTPQRVTRPHAQSAQRFSNRLQAQGARVRQPDSKSDLPAQSFLAHAAEGTSPYLVGALAVGALAAGVIYFKKNSPAAPSGLMSFSPPLAQQNPYQVPVTGMGGAAAMGAPAEAPSVAAASPPQPFQHPLLV